MFRFLRAACWSGVARHNACFDFFFFFLPGFGSGADNSAINYLFLKFFFVKLIDSKTCPLPAQISVLQDTDLLRFVFDRDPNAVRERLPEFAGRLGPLLDRRWRRRERPVAAPAARPEAAELSLQLHETEFYSKVDGSIDFGRTRSRQFCFFFFFFFFFLILRTDPRPGERPMPNQYLSLYIYSRCSCTFPCCNQYWCH